MDPYNAQVPQQQQQVPMQQQMPPQQQQMPMQAAAPAVDSYDPYGAPPQNSFSSYQQGPKPCFSWRQSGQCRFGDQCRYSHQVEVDGTPPPMQYNRSYNSYDNGGGYNSGYNRPRGMCNNWSRYGNCKFGDDCRFSHDMNSQGSSSFGKSYNSYSNYNGGYNRPKTRICFSYRDTGSCQFGDGCRFLHDPNAADASSGGYNSGSSFGGNNWRSNNSGQVRICFRYRDTGSCQYGDSCRYSHDVQQQSSSPQYDDNAVDNVVDSTVNDDVSAAVAQQDNAAVVSDANTGEGDNTGSPGE